MPTPFGGFPLAGAWRVCKTLAMPNVVSPTILVVDDERAIADTVVYALRTEGFSPEWCGTISAARTWLDKRTPALVVLDVGLPDGNGFDFCRELRRQHPQLPVIFLTARNELIDRVVGLEIGGDDYLAKPFSPRELTARVKAVLRRPPMVAAPACAPMAHADGMATWAVDEGRCRISYRGTALDLTATEFRLLRALVGQPGRVFTRDQLMEAAWSDPGASVDRTVDAHVKTLRAKLRAAGATEDPIQTHRGLGYSLREDL